MSIVPTAHPSVLSTNMHWSSDNLESLLGQIIGDPTHHLKCRWAEDNGVRCQNLVSKDSRIDGAICLKMFQDLPTGHSPAMGLSKAARPVKQRKLLKLSKMGTISLFYRHTAGRLACPT
ncbi:hypothetical protein PCH_Pc13g00500 [Penicillium rubens Wisconsin 54-1255]|uniref:Uncharacterized protein n=1 Tax=Penicillium rubens (strain ATCC 28089 / DSM 1075 / NRRL 1951 / Wisconsin 54-1255) TaxID=500485 RepID=B6H188_PENRW|nr:hypothetical protein PCH_Pc13g00500 [Penicillium rubens Wisconsin 54-1255]